MTIEFEVDQTTVKKLTNRTFKVEMWVNENEAVKMGTLLAVPDDLETHVTIEVKEKQ